MHDRLSASYAERLMACPGSADLEVSIPGFQYPVVDEEKGARGKGTHWHELLEGVVSSTTQRELQAFTDALQYVAELRARRRFNVLTEATAQIDWLLSRPKTTVDLVLHTKDELHILDYKTGKIPVNVFNNTQLLYYAAAFEDLSPKAKTITLHIVQPWANNTDCWEVPRLRIMEFKRDLIAAEAEILSGSKELRPGDHCKFCAANPHTRGDKGTIMCPPMMDILYPRVTVDEEEILNDLDE